MNAFARYQHAKLQEAYRLFASGALRRPIRNSADARRRLAEIRAEETAARYQRLARLTDEVAPPAVTSSGGSVGLRIDPQGRVRLVCWDVGQVVVRPARGR